MDSLKCPITCEIFIDPVTAQDGHTYERKAITDWLKQNPTSPITREPMGIGSLRPNYIVKKMLEEFQSTILKKHYHFELNIDIRKTKNRPLFQAPGKTIYEAEWISRAGPPIVLLRIDGAKARREAEFYVQLGCHPHIVRTYGMLESEPNTLTLVQEFASEGDLSELLREKRFRPSPAVLLEIFIQIADAMVCLADNNIVHGDLACRNVLVFRMDNYDPKGNLVKLTDFGLTRASTLYTVANSAASATMIIIPVRYAAPEILQNADISKYTEKSDVYSMGVLMWEAYSAGQIPYASIDNDGEVRRLKLRGQILTQPDNCDQALWNIITSCWQQQPNVRPTFKTLKQSLLDIQFEKRFSSMNLTNNQQAYTKNFATGLSCFNSYDNDQKALSPSTAFQRYYSNSNDYQQEQIEKIFPLKTFRLQCQSQHQRYDDQWTNDNDYDDEEEVQRSFHQQSDGYEVEACDEEEMEPSFYQQPQYYKDETYDEEVEEVESSYHQQSEYYEDNDEEETGLSFHPQPQYYEHETDENNDEEETGLSFHPQPQYYEHETDEDNDEEETGLSFHPQPQYYEHETDENNDEEETGLSFHPQPQYYEHETDENNDEEEVELSFYPQSQYYEHESDKDNDEEEAGLSFHPQPQYYEHETDEDNDEDELEPSFHQQILYFNQQNLYNNNSNIETLFLFQVQDPQYSYDSDDE